MVEKTFIIRLIHYNSFSRMMHSRKPETKISGININYHELSLSAIKNLKKYPIKPG